MTDPSTQVEGPRRWTIGLWCGQVVATPQHGSLIEGSPVPVREDRICESDVEAVAKAKMESEQDVFGYIWEDLPIETKEREMDAVRPLLAAVFPDGPSND